jgi:4-hydroxy-tetrahydrodipicolinate synthase
MHACGIVMHAVGDGNIGHQEGLSRSMAGTTLRGVIAAVATAIDETGEPDCARSIAVARFLLDNGCDGLNVLGTTGEGTSFSLLQRLRVMSAYAASGLPVERMLVGTGAAALADALVLTSRAAELGFGGALVLPPFYYKGVPDEGLVAVIEAIVKATTAQPIPIYLYHSRRSRDYLGISRSFAASSIASVSACWD